MTAQQPLHSSAPPRLCGENLFKQLTDNQIASAD
jgi:hypothetical protein